MEFKDDKIFDDYEEEFYEGRNEPEQLNLPFMEDYLENALEEPIGVHLFTILLFNDLKLHSIRLTSLYKGLIESYTKPPASFAFKEQINIIFRSKEEQRKRDQPTTSIDYGRIPSECDF